MLRVRLARAEPTMHRSFRVLFAVVTVSVAVLHSAKLRAQGTTGPVIRDSNVGYIDPAIPADLFRFRYDAAYDNNRPTRAEFFWSPGEPFGAGPIFQSVASIIRICCFTTSTLLIRNCRHLWNCRCDF